MMPQPKQYPVNDGEVALVKDLQENYSLGYVRLYRSLQNKSWYKKSEYVHLWIHLFVKATRKEREDWFGGKPVKLMPGQFITGRKKLSDETGINESKVERILKTFEIEQQIEQQKSNISRLISIRNWHLYQSFEQQIEQQVNNKRTTSEQQVNTIQEVREYREVKNIIQDAPFVDDDLNSAWSEWMQYRKETKNHLTPTAVKKQVTFLKKYSPTVAVSIIEESINNNWRGLFPPKHKSSSIKQMVD